MSRNQGDNNNNNSNKPKHSNNETKNNNNSDSNTRKIEFATSKKNLILNNNKEDEYIQNVNNNLPFIYEFIRSKSAIAGVLILLFLVSMTLYAFFGIPFASFKEWNNPTYWI